jgi:predicted dinucleotide-binding enzyme
MTEKDIKVPFVKIAVIDVKGGSDSTDDAEMIQVAKEKAGEIGVNGLILGEMTEASTAEKVVHTLVGGKIADKKGKLVAIRLKQ